MSMKDRSRSGDLYSLIYVYLQLILKFATWSDLDEQNTVLCAEKYMWYTHTHTHTHLYIYIYIYALSSRGLSTLEGNLPATPKAETH